MKILAIDYGTKYIGLAISNPGATIAFPFQTLANDARLMANLKKIVRAEAIEQLVVGMPKSYQQTSTINAIIEKFLSDLANLNHPNLSITTVDELLTSEATKKMPAQGGHSTNHELAAMLILEQYLQTSACVTSR